MLARWKLLLFLSAISIYLAPTKSRSRDGNERDCSTIKWSEALEVTSTEIAVRWDCCTSRSTPSYRLKLASLDHGICDCDLKHHQDTNRCSHTFSNLCPHTNYQFTVSKYRPVDTDNIHNDDVQENFTINVQTHASAPGKVVIKEAKAINDTAVDLKWENNCPNGEVLYNVTWSPDERAFLTRELALTILHLKPAKVYTFLIHACNSINTSFVCSKSNITLVKTLPGEPSEPAKFEAVEVSMSDIRLRWKHPENPNGLIDGYEIVCRPVNDTNFKPIPILINKREECLVTGLEPSTNYSCSIQAFNLHDFHKITGNPSALTIVTNPKIFQCANNHMFNCGQGQCVLRVWVCDGEKDCENGHDEKDCEHHKRTCGSRSFLCLSGECVDGNRRCNGVQYCRDESDEMYCALDRPQSLKIVERTSNKLFLKWDKRVTPWGSDGYVVRASDGKVTIESISSSQEFYFSGLSPWTQYEITVHAFKVFGNDTLMGKVASMSGKTRPTEPSAPRDVKVVKTTSGETYLTWKPPLNPNGEINGYHVKTLNDESEVILPSSSLKHHLNFLITDTNYTFSVNAYNLDNAILFNGTLASVNYTTKPEEPSVSEMVNLIRKDMVREFSKQQALMRNMIRLLGEENGTGNESFDNKSLTAYERHGSLTTL